ncbi:MAG TPA: S41 family peptidase, partial [Anaerolineae bacterium]|nr:S41 family peptidase [Anaerolineae bacterium]
SIPAAAPIEMPAASPTPLGGGQAAAATVDQTAPAAASTVDPETTARHLRIFEQLWNTVDTQYVYADFNGVDWLAAHGDFKSRVESGLSDEGFWQAMSEMIARLDDKHSTFLTPDEARKEDAQLKGDLSYVGIGVYAGTQPEKQQAVIFSVLPGSPADEAGLRAHDAILTIDGQPAAGGDGSDNLDLLHGRPGTQTVLTVRSPGEAPREVRLTRRRIGGTLLATGRILPVEGTSLRIGYLAIPTFWDASIAIGARQALAELMAAGPLDGLIIDMRINGGGVSTNLLALLGFFTSGPHGEFAGRDQARPLDVTAEPVGNSQDVPLAILTGPHTQSYAEVFSGVLREAGRARLVGMTSPGNVETIYGYDFEDGSRAWIAREGFTSASGADWEGIGLVPDSIVDADWDEFTEENDPYIAAALALFAASAGAAAPR